MSTCEKCWADAHSVADEYVRLLRERRDHPCSPEEQAGPNARECPWCGRMTLHQHTGEPMCGCPPIIDVQPVRMVHCEVHPWMPEEYPCSLCRWIELGRRSPREEER